MQEYTYDYGDLPDDATIITDAKMNDYTTSYGEVVVLDNTGVNNFRLLDKSHLILYGSDVGVLRILGAGSKISLMDGSTVYKIVGADNTRIEISDDSIVNMVLINKNLRKGIVSDSETSSSRALRDILILKCEDYDPSDPHEADENCVAVDFVVRTTVSGKSLIKVKRKGRNGPLVTMSIGEYNRSKIEKKIRDRAMYNDALIAIINRSSTTLSELKALAKSLNLSATGNKTQIRERIRTRLLDMSDY